MEYRNIKTGVVIYVTSEINGELWEPVEAPEAPAEKPKKATSRKAKK